MKTHPETTLAILPAQCQNERLVLVLCADPTQGSHLELRQQSWGEGVGWFTQSSVPVEPQQVAQLRTALGSGSATVPAATISWNAANTRPRQQPGALRVLRADSA